jgi:hypothetical protein
MQMTLQAKPPDWITFRRQPDAQLADALREALLGLPSQFECLIFIASLQNRDARDNFCDSHRLNCEPESADILLCGKHHEVFEEWLLLTLEDKLSDLEAYALGRRIPVTNIARQWLLPGRRDCLIPRGAMTPEKQLFDSDAETLMILSANG